MKTVFRLSLLTMFFVLIGLASLFVKPDSVKAGIVRPGGEGYDDSFAIQSELNESGKVTLVAGETYYLYRTLILSSNMEIDAGGATVICEKPIAFNIPERANYGAAENISITGGTWKSGGEGYFGTSFKFIHARNLKFKNMTIRASNFKGHSLELVACKDVLIENCDISGVGESFDYSDHFREEAVQLDIAEERTAPFLRGIPFYTDIADELYTGAGCENITVKKCTIVGNRGLSANYSPNGLRDTYHKNIKLLNNKITGLQAEAVVLFNTASATVKGNRIETKRKGFADAYTVGLHFAAFSKRKELTKGKFTITGNSIYGGRQALLMHSHSGIRFGAAKIENNKLFCKAGARYALHAKEASIQKVSLKKNKLKGYKEKK